MTIPLTQDKDHPVLDHQVRHDVVLQTDPPKVGTLLRFVAEADDRCVRGVQTGRSSLLQLQVVSADELFYEILIRQRAERAKFLAVLESLEKQTPVLAGEPKADDFLRVMRLEHTGSRQLDQIAGRIGDTLQEMKLNQIGSPKSHRLLQDGVIDPMRALTAGPMNQLRGVLQTLAGRSSTAVANEGAARRLHDGSCYNNEEDPRSDVAMGKLRRRRQSGRRSHSDGAKGPAGHGEGAGNPYEGGFR